MPRPRPRRGAARTARLRPRGPYTEWLWPEPPALPGGTTGFRSFAHTLTPETDPGPRSCWFWAHQFRTVAGEGGYVGLQTWGNRADGSVGKIAIFSMWDALEGRGPGVVPFSGEGAGWSCRIPWMWEAGRPYRLEVAAPAEPTEPADPAGAGRWWTATVDGVEIGRIRVPAAWGGLRSWSVMWTEYYGPPVADCSDLPYVSATFSEPEADGAGVRPRGRRSRIGGGDCSTTRVSDAGTGVRQEMGLLSAPGGGR